MPNNLTSQPIRTTYGQLLHVADGVTPVLKPVCDGDGTFTALKMSEKDLSVRKTLTIEGEAGQTDPLFVWRNLGIITAGGLVGVGTQTPTFAANDHMGVHVHGETTGAAYKLTTRTSGQTETDGVDIYLDQAGAMYFWNRENSNVIFGTNDRAAVQLTPGATAWSAASDERLKNITGKFDNPLRDIKKINPIKFTWKDDATNKPNVGLTAQSVQEVIPEAIEEFHQIKPNLTQSKETYLSVRYTDVIPLLVAAVQELTAEVERLKKAAK